jgi:hypothetical protein
VVFDRSNGGVALARFRRTDVAPVVRTSLTVLPTTNLVATDDEVTFGFFTSISNGSPPRGRGTIARTRLAPP